MRRGTWTFGGAVIVFLLAPAWSAHAQERVTLRADLLFYGDNTEFRNPFRQGETILGAAVRLDTAAEVNERVTLTLGVLTNQRFGADDAFELVRPVVALTIRGGRSSFVFGTFPSPPFASGAAVGPDRQGPHGLLPPLQRETLTFDRPYEAGLQWTFSGATLRHELWINWQRLNTPSHRERFDGGARGELRIAGPLNLPFHFHVVHEGGQLFAAGPVADSLAGGTGVILRGRAGPMETVAIDLLGLVSRFVPDRGAPDRTRNGAGFFGRAAAEQAGWRGHIIFWRGCDFIKDEGDPNYMSIRRDGTLYRGTRDYAEAGLTRRFQPAPGVTLAASARLHRVERHYEYSYRILGVAALRWRVR